MLLIEVAIASGCERDRATFRDFPQETDTYLHSCFQDWWMGLQYDVSRADMSPGETCFNESLKEIEPCNPGPLEVTPADCCLPEFLKTSETWFAAAAGRLKREAGELRAFWVAGAQPAAPA